MNTNFRFAYDLMANRKCVSKNFYETYYRYMKCHFNYISSGLNRKSIIACLTFIRLTF